MLEFHNESPCADGRCIRTSGRSRPTPIYFIFPDRPWPQPALLFYKRVFYPPLTGASFPSSTSTGVAMLALPLLFATLFLAAVRAAVPSYGHNVVPYIPQVRQSRPLPVSWAALINP